MDKFMFNERFGLQQAVFDRLKTDTRRIEKCLSVLPTEFGEGEYVVPHLENDKFIVRKYWQGALLDTYTIVPKFKVGDVVAIAQRYKDAGVEPSTIVKMIDEGQNMFTPVPAFESPGWKNKMFVKAELMPKNVEITNVRLQRLQDISEEDCRKEGIIPVTWRQYHKQDWNDLSPQRYTDHDVWTLPKFREGIENPWAESDPDEYMAETAKAAFAVLIFKLMGRKVWDSNPWVLVYSFKLLD